MGCAAQAPASWRREGKVRGSEAAAGSRTYVPSACWRRRCAELACQGDSRALGRLTSRRPRRAGQGRLDCARGPARRGFARVWRPELVPPLRFVHKPMARRPLPRAALPSPRGWPPGRAGEKGWGDWAHGLPSRGFPGDRLRGARSRPGGRRLGIRTEGSRRPGRLPWQILKTAPLS